MEGLRIWWYINTVIVLICLESGRLFKILLLCLEKSLKTNYDLFPSTIHLINIVILVFLEHF